MHNNLIGRNPNLGGGGGGAPLDPPPQKFKRTTVQFWVPAPAVPTTTKLIVLVVRESIP